MGKKPQTNQQTNKKKPREKGNVPAFPEKRIVA